MVWPASAHARGVAADALVSAAAVVQLSGPVDAGGPVAVLVAETPDDVAWMILTRVAALVRHPGRRAGRVPV